MLKITNTELIMTLVAETVEKVRYSNLLTGREMLDFENKLKDACMEIESRTINIYPDQQWAFWDGKEQA